jgi:hypothetical protein
LAGLTALVLNEISEFFIDINRVEIKMKDFFLAFDEIQVLNGPGWAGLYCKNRANGTIMSFARFFTWTNERLKALHTVISGTGIGIANLDSIISSAIKSESEIQFDILTPEKVQQTFETVLSKAGSHFPHLKLIIKPSEQVFWKLQGRPRILMRYIKRLLKSDGTKTSDEVFDEYEQDVCFPRDQSAFDSFGNLWIRFLSTEDKTISFSLSKNVYSV